jgi:hypothetical protein
VVAKPLGGVNVFALGARRDAGRGKLGNSTAKKPNFFV